MLFNNSFAKVCKPNFFSHFFYFIDSFGTVSSAITVRIDANDANDAVGSLAFWALSSRSRVAQRV